MLPRAYQRWIGDWLAAPIPEEKLATCDTCAMSAPPGTPEDALHEYYGASKCCTYFPSLPNFQVGGLLGDADFSEGARRVSARIAGGIGIDPLGVRSDKRRSELYRIGARAGFGKAEAFKCPYYIDGAAASCSVWRYREAVCSTYYCKFNSPVRGREFWDDLKGLVMATEHLVAVHAAMELGIPAATIDQLIENSPALNTTAEVDNVPDRRAHAKLWGDWVDREEAYYKDCARIAEGLDLAAIRRLGGQQYERRLTSVRKAYDALVSTELPERLRIASSLQVSSSPTPGKLRLIAGPNQPIEMAAVVMELLSHFHGQPLDEAKATLAELGYEVEAGFLEKLYKCGFLVAAT